MRPAHKIFINRLKWAFIEEYFCQIGLLDWDFWKAEAVDTQRMF